MNNSIDQGINYRFEDTRFIVEYRCSREVGTFRQEFEQRARDLFKYNPKLMLGLSTGLDSQIVLHSFLNQEIPIRTCFLYFPGYNNEEYNQLQILIKKYNLDPTIVEIDPEVFKEEALYIYETQKIAPLQWFHKMFLDQLPLDYDFIQGIDGPDFTNRKGKIYLVESSDSLEISKVMALQKSNRTGKVIGFSRTGEILLSILNDDVTRSFLYSRNYFKNNNLFYENNKEIPIIDHWDLYIKPFLYTKHWKDELEYFPKYKGSENIKWIEERKWQNYRNNLILVPYDELVQHLMKKTGTVKKYIAGNANAIL
jgi:hypothetical protein